MIAGHTKWDSPDVQNAIAGLYVIAGHTKWDSPDVRNVIARLYERYGLAVSSGLNVRAISFSVLS